MLLDCIADLRPSMTSEQPAMPRPTSLPVQAPVNLKYITAIILLPVVLSPVSNPSPSMPRTPHHYINISSHHACLRLHRVPVAQLWPPPTTPRPHPTNMTLAEYFMRQLRQSSTAPLASPPQVPEPESPSNAKPLVLLATGSPIQTLTTSVSALSSSASMVLETSSTTM